MAKIPVYVSFDYDHDADLKTLLVGQAANTESPFDVADWSIKKASPDWQEDAARRIRRVDQVIVICGEHTDTASGVDVEVKIAQAEGRSYFLLYGRSTKNCKKPSAARLTDKMYEWSWVNLKRLIAGAR